MVKERSKAIAKRNNGDLLDERETALVKRSDDDNRKVRRADSSPTLPAEGRWGGACVNVFRYIFLTHYFYLFSIHRITPGRRRRGARRKR